MADIFISYSQRAPEPTQSLAAALIERGIDAWFDVNLLPGQAFGKVIDAEIDRAKAVITIWSPPALLSNWVAAESERALRQDKLICVRTSDVSPKDLPTPFNRLQTALVSDLEAIVAALTVKGVRRGKASVDGLVAEHGVFGEAAIAWQSVKDSAEASELEAFLEYYHAAPFYRLLATRKLARMRVAVVVMPAPAAVPLPRPEDVTIRIDPGMHTTSIRSIALSTDGRLLATGSEDKTVKLWALPDGKLVRTLRPPIGPGNDGKVYAVALALDGSWVAAGGWDAAWSSEQRCYVHIFDTATGVIRRRLGPLPNVIDKLEVSPDGGRLAAGLAGANGVRVWETKAWQQVAEDRDYAARVNGLTFTADGRLAATSEDRIIRLYGADGKLVRKTTAPGGEPYGLAFSPDGRALAVGYHVTDRVDVLAGDTLAHMFSPDTSSVTNGNLSSVAWADGARLVASGRYYDANRAFPILVWPDRGRGPRGDLPGPAETVMALCGRNGVVAFGAGDPAFGLFDAQGRRVLFRGPPMADLRGSRGDQFLVSADGRRVRFSLKLNADRWLFDLAGPTFTQSPTAPADMKAPIVQGLPIEGWEGTTEAKLRGKPLPLSKFEMSRNLAIFPDQRSFMLGTDYSLRRFDQSGEQLWTIAVPDVVYGVNLARDGRIAIAAYGDGTIRWHRASDGKELLALFIPQDDPNAAKRWVLWTPEGHYTASPGGEDLIGWHVNRGLDQAADFFPAETFKSTFHKPEVVRAALDKI